MFGSILGRSRLVVNNEPRQSPDVILFAMFFARVLVGLVAALICIAGIGWYAVYLFSQDPRRTATGASSSTSSPVKMHPAYARRKLKRSVIGGFGAILGGLLLVPGAID